MATGSNVEPPTPDEHVTGRRESDVAGDDAQALSRVTGGVEGADGGDAVATTGTAPSGTFVGRDAGQDEGYAGETGAERRGR
jgi:hypothetical protein